MKRLPLPCLVVVLVFLLSAPASALHETAPSDASLALPGPDAEKLRDFILKQAPYTTWDLWPGKGRFYKASAHGELLTTFLNHTAQDSLAGGKGMADGSIIVKESYSPEKKLTGIVVMYKVKGYNPDAGDWFWAKYAPEGKVLASGKVRPCIDCHEKKKDNDFVLTGTIK